VSALEPLLLLLLLLLLLVVVSEQAGLVFAGLHAHPVRASVCCCSWCACVLDLQLAGPARFCHCLTQQPLWVLLLLLSLLLLGLPAMGQGGAGCCW
jgi:hypothetical protein